MPDPLHQLIADLVTMSHRTANKNIRRWLDTGSVSVADLRYVVRFLQVRNHGTTGTEWRIGMAALFVALPTLILTVFAGFTAEGTDEQLFPYVVWILGLSTAGILWTLGFAVVDTFRSAHDRKLFAEIELRAELTARTPEAGATRRAHLLAHFSRPAKRKRG